jgi:hypothetical protein
VAAEVETVDDRVGQALRADISWLGSRAYLPPTPRPANTSPMSEPA